MRIATWNINSVRARHERALAVLERWGLDVLLLRETKCRLDQFPAAEFETAGYEATAYGLDQWNGVAILSRVGVEEVIVGFEGQPAFGKEGAESKAEARMIGARCDGVGMWSLYVPSGRALDDLHYPHKLEFLAALRRATGTQLAEDSSAQLLLVGDQNVVPSNAGVWDPELLQDELYASDPEREAFHTFADAGFTEVTRDAIETLYTFQDYQRLRSPKNEGMRIDFAWASPALAGRVAAAHIGRNERKDKGASDHVPVVVELA